MTGMKKKTIRIWYWIVTILFAAFMIFSGGSEILRVPSADALLVSLGYPVYLNYILGIAKIFGAIVLLVPMFNVLKEWAYAGFTIDLVGAGASFLLAGAGFVSILGVLPFIVVMFLSYWLWKKAY